MQSPSTVNVLVVGAGPTGLSVAISATLAGCGDIMVVDSLERGQNSSRATVVHALTLEVLERIGVTPALVQAGNKSTSTVFYSGNSTLLEIPFNKVHEKYNYMLTLPQSQTEQILAARFTELGGKVHYLQKIVAVRDVEEELKTVVFADGKVIKARYVIGADGLNSVVREQAGIAYVDPTPGRPSDFWVGQMCLADVRFESSLASSVDQFRACVSTRGIVGMIPLPDGRVRVFAGVPKDAVIPQHPDINYIRNILKDRGIDKQVKSVEWSSRFRVRSRLAERFYLPAKNGRGAILLAGDAAHTHSPAGGQGMNLGLIDGVYLAQALRAYMDTGKEEFLATYSRERKERAKVVITAAERISFTGERLLTWQAVWVQLAARILNLFPSITAKIALSMSGTSAAQSSF